MDRPFTAPELNLASFHCPHCHAFAQQHWGAAQRSVAPVSGWKICKCNHCGRCSLFDDELLVYPKQIGNVRPNADLSEDTKNDFEEARQIVTTSPRGAAALLRLCIQKLCVELGQPGKNIDNDIAALVRDGLPPIVQKSMDVVRVIGNECVHPGVLDMEDDVETANALFVLVNLIANVMISQPKQVQSVYNSLPASKREGIETRDKQS